MTQSPDKEDSHTPFLTFMIAIDGLFAKNKKESPDNLSLGKGIAQFSLGEEIAQLMKPILTIKNLLSNKYCQPSDNLFDLPKPYIIKATDDYTIESFVWRPGQSTSIHDHKCLCVAGVIQGTEVETRYTLHDNYVKMGKTTKMNPGQISILNSEDIHSVKNDGDDIAISLHIYAADITKVETSINNIYELKP
ncbi:Hypothetical protein HVR_LOCUS689 [uncultured virus]|nr:Hypothetical protein HVR_LOCUS689 [uncultured virus]